MSSILPKRQKRKINHTFQAHPPLIPRPLPPLPKPTALLPHQHPPANPTVLRPIILLPATEAADHPVRMLVRVPGRRVMALVAREHTRAAREPEPAVRFLVVRTAAAERKFTASGDAEGGFF